MTETLRWYVGIDWGSQEHHLCVLAADGRIAGTRVVRHTADAVHDAMQWLRQVTGATPETIAVGIETPRGPVVDALLEPGFSVWAINPKQLDRLRDRFTAAGAKDDRRDAHALADGLRTDARAFRRVRPDDPLIIQLREASRLLEDLQVDRARLTNRLREQLFRVNAPWLTLSPAADEPWLWRVLAEVPHPAAWPALGKRRLAAALRAHRIRRVTAEGVLEILRQPTLAVAAGVPDAVATRIAALVPQLQLLAAQQQQAEHQLDELLDRLETAPVPEGESRQHPDAQILRSLPGVGRIVSARMLTEAAGPLRDRDHSSLRAHTGVAPVTKRSGKRLWIVTMRYACKPRLREAMYHWARTSIRCDAATRRYYDRLRARGHQHARALRSVADRWLRILVAMLRTGTLYDPTQFRQPAAHGA